MNKKRPGIPDHFDPSKVDKIRKVDYQKLAVDAGKWVEEYNITPAAKDKIKVTLVLIDVQNTFCLPDFELFVRGRSGRGAVEDNIRLCKFIYRNLDIITEIIPTMDTHQSMQIFHSIFLINDKGENPPPYSLITYDDIIKGKWKINTYVSDFLGLDEKKARRHLIHYTKTLEETGKYNLTIWPYHAMLGGIGHSLVPSVEEAIFFHSIARYSQPDFQVKGRNPLTEHYSVLGPEIQTDADGNRIAEKNSFLLDKLIKSDIIIITGQAKSHCVVWTIDDLLKEIMVKDKNLVSKIYLLEDTTSPVVVPGVTDYTDEADRAFKRFKESGIHIIKSTDETESVFSSTFLREKD